MKIILSGPKGSGKSTLGGRLARILDIPFIETDKIIEDIFMRESGKPFSCRDIFREHGEDFFRQIEKRAVNEAASLDWCLVSTGGGTLMNPGNRDLLLRDSLFVLLTADSDLLWQRITQNGIPPFLAGDDGRSRMEERNRLLLDAVSARADIVFTVSDQNLTHLHKKIADEIVTKMMLRMTSPSTFGEIIRTTTFGESHGPALGAVLDGLRPGIMIDETDIQRELDRRRPGQSKVVTPRQEDDRVHILSGVFEGKTTGAPVCMIIYNKDQDSSKYDLLKDVFRPGHADFTFWKKYGIRDHRGGGRTSGRETVARVASGAVAKKVLSERGIAICAWSEEIAGIRGETVDRSFIEKNIVRAADQVKAPLMEEAILKARQEKDSVGGIVHLNISGCPAGLGDPVFFKLDARLAMALFSIGAVKGVEVGAGFAAARMRGSENNDPMRDNKFLANNAGGIIGGISTGEEIFLRVAIKPTPSIAREQETVDTCGNNRTIIIEGRHDPCIVPRVVPVIESMAALVILDAMEICERIGRRTERANELSEEEYPWQGI